jgi:stalled ribosome alternative rescue factor ArfA
MGVMISRKLKNDRQHDGQKIKDNRTQQMIYKALHRKLKIEQAKRPGANGNRGEMTRWGEGGTGFGAKRPGTNTTGPTGGI